MSEAAQVCDECQHLKGTTAKMTPCTRLCYLTKETRHHIDEIFQSSLEVFERLENLILGFQWIDSNVF